MNRFNSVVVNNKKLVSVRAYQGDAMTLLAFDLDESQTGNFVGFSIHVTAGTTVNYYLLNRLAFNDTILQKNGISKKDAASSLFSPFQKFRWIHVPATNHNTDTPFYGDYTYEITPRYLIDDILQPLNPDLTVGVTIEVKPFKKGNLKLGFTRAFISSQGYTNKFGNFNKMRPNNADLIFDITMNSGPLQADSLMGIQSYTYEKQYKYLGWQVRERIFEFLDEVTGNNQLKLDVFAFDLDEPEIVKSLLSLAEQNRLRIILDNSKDHIKNDCFEEQFEMELRNKCNARGLNPDNIIVRGKFQSLSHSKIFIQKDNNGPMKVLTGSTNFTTNGFYINANHIIIFEDHAVAGLYEEVFNASFGKKLMNSFKGISLAATEHTGFGNGIPDMTIRFSPHTRTFTDGYFKSISDRIAGPVNGAKSDVLFAIMNDVSQSSILDAVKTQVKSDKVFTYGIVDKTGKDYGVSLYKPQSKRGIRVTGKGTATSLPPPFQSVASIPGISIHHKFIVVDFKTANPVVYCGSSNLAYNPEQRNGDNLIEIRDPDVVTAFAIEAIRLVDHYHWRNVENISNNNNKPINLNDNKGSKGPWYKSYYDPLDMHCADRLLFIES